jgi:hypothetical protein
VKKKTSRYRQKGKKHEIGVKCGIKADHRGGVKVDQSNW